MRHPRLSFPVLLLLLFPAALLGQHPLTSPLPVNVPNGQSSYLYDVAASSRGDFVVTWSQAEAGLGLYDLYARRFSADGTPVTGALLVTSYFLILQEAVAVREDGSFLIAFAEGSDVTVRLYGPDGAFVRDSLAPEGEYPALALRGDGTFLLAWERFGMIFTRTFSADGTPLGPEHEIASAALMASPRAVAGPDRGFVMVWSRVGPPTPANPRHVTFTVVAQRLGPAGAPRGTPITVRPQSVSSSPSPDLGRDAGGNFLVVWNERFGAGDRRILGQGYTAAGAPLGGLLTLERSAAAGLARIAMAPSGDFVVVWMEGESPGQLLAQRFTARGASSRPAFQVDTPSSAVTQDPRVAGNANGDFVVAWAAGDDIFVRLYRKR